MGYPRKNIQASCWLYRDKDFYTAYLKIGEQLIFTTSAEENVHLHGYIPGEARRAPFSKLPGKAQEEFRLILADYNLTDKAHGLEPKSEFVEIDREGDWVILKRMKNGQPYRVNPIRVRHKGEEVWKGQTIAEAHLFIESSL